MDTVQTITLAIAVAGLALGGLNTYVQWKTFRSDRPALEVVATWALPVYNTPSGRQVGASMVQATATNTGRQPIGVTGLALGVTGDRTIPFEHVVPGCTVPVVLQPGEHTAMWMELDPLEQSLREERAKIVSVIANGPGSQKWVNRKVSGIGVIGQPE